MSKYSSYKNHQLITENWRKFLAEDEGPEGQISAWSQMFPRAAAALESVGLRLDQLVDNLIDATQGDPERDLTIDATPGALPGTHPGDAGVVEE